MLDYIWHHSFALLGLSGLLVAACLAVAWFFPPLRRIAIEIAVAILGAASIYAKGVKDRADLEAKRKEEAVKKAQSDYAKIDARPDTPDDTDKRLRDGSF